MAQADDDENLAAAAADAEAGGEERQEETAHVASAASSSSSHRERKSCWKRQNDDDCLSAWSVIPRLTALLAWVVSLTLLLDCQFIYLDLERTITTTTTAIFNNGSDVDNATTTSYDVQILHADRINFGLYRHEAFEFVERSLNDTGGGENNITILELGEGGEGEDNNETTTNKSIAFFDLVNLQQCVLYPPANNANASLKTARACAIIAVVLGGWMTFLLWCMFCCRVCCLFCPDLLMFGTFLVILPVCQGLTMMLSHNVCALTPDLLYAAAAAQQPGAMIAAPADFLNGVVAARQSILRAAHCGVSRQGLSYPFSIALWLTTGIFYVVLRPSSRAEFNYFPH